MEIIRHDSSHDIKTQVGTGVTHVRRVIDRRTACVPFDVPGGVGDEGFFFAREGVAKEEGAGGCQGWRVGVVVFGGR
jgi:hypothetical protein